jgi:hypothetical protein
MIIKPVFILTLIFVGAFASAQAKTHWVRIGEGTYNQGFTFPYKISLFVPYGVRNIHDIKQMQYEIKINLDWLLIESSQKQIKQLFQTQLKEKFSSEENFKLYTRMIDLFLDSLPAVKKHNQWEFIFSPDVGTKLYIDNQLVYHLVGSDLNKALINSWLNKDPVLTSNLFTRLLKVQK